MIPALTLTNIVFTYPGTSEPLLDGIDVTFARGWTAVLGDNGIGKTTLSKLAIGRLSPDVGRISPTPNRLHTGYCPQNTDETPENLEDFACDWSPQAMEIRRELGIGDDWPWRPGTLSGGEAKRLQIACALATDPDVLVLDEPTNDLDIVTLGILEEYLQAFRGCVIVVSHDRYFVDKVADHLLVFCGGGEIRDFAGTYSEYVAWKREYEAARRAEAAQARPKPQAAKTQAAKTQAAEAVPRKLSFNEKRELEALETEIPALEAEKAALEASLSSGTLPVEELTAQSRRIAELIASIDEKTMRWLELSER